jgi:prepilin-type N-terminal cleavage/methylation domain-containing protein
MRVLGNKRGMTLVEVIVAMGVISLLSACLLAMLMQGLRGWSSGAGDEAANSTATTALQRLAYDIREARSATANGSQLIVTFPLTIVDPSTHETAYDATLNDPVTRSYYVDANGNLVRSVAGVTTILRRGVTSVSFGTAANSVEITVTAKQQLGRADEERTQQASGRVSFRNYN